MAKVKRSQVATFLNTGTLVTPVWSLIGIGVTQAAIAYNPKVTEENYIHEDSATIFVESYAPKMPVEATAINTDAVFEYLDNIRKLRSVGASVETEVCNVWLYETPTLDEYPAEKQAVSVSIDEFGGDGGTAAKINYTINFIGDAVVGEFDVVLLEFTATP